MPLKIEGNLELINRGRDLGVRCRKLSTMDLVVDADGAAAGASVRATCTAPDTC